MKVYKVVLEVQKHPNIGSIEQLKYYIRADTGEKAIEKTWKCVKKMYPKATLCKNDDVTYAFRCYFQTPTAC